jgi:hypothetical protein
MAKAKQEEVANPFGEDYKESVPGLLVKWETLGQTFKGTFKGAYEAENSITGLMQKIYEFVGEDGEDYRVGTRGEIFDRQMAKLHIGQKCGFLYAQDIPSKKKGNNAFKLIKIYPGPLDSEYVHTEDIATDYIPF